MFDTYERGLVTNEQYKDYIRDLQNERLAQFASAGAEKRIGLAGRLFAWVASLVRPDAEQRDCAEYDNDCFSYARVQARA